MIFSKLGGAAALLAMLASTVSATPMRRLRRQASSTGDTAAGATSSPFQTGVVAGCTKFYLVKSGDTCSSVVSANGIQLNDFHTWNPTLGSSCNSLWLNAYVCVGTSGSSSATNININSSSPGAESTSTGADGESTSVVTSQGTDRASDTDTDVAARDNKNTGKKAGTATANSGHPVVTPFMKEKRDEESIFAARDNQKTGKKTGTTTANSGHPVVTPFMKEKRDEESIPKPKHAAPLHPGKSKRMPVKDTAIETRKKPVARMVKRKIQLY